MCHGHQLVDVGCVTRRRAELISDYGGHPFTYDLFVRLRGRGRSVAYSFCANTISPKAEFHPDDDVHAVGSGRTFEKYHPARRLLSELRYGLALSLLVWRVRPRRHVVCNMPLVSLLVVWVASVPLRIRTVVWLQDLQSGLAAGIVDNPAITRSLSVLEGFLLRRADRVIAISDVLAAEAVTRGVDPGRVRVHENWAPLEDLPVVPRQNRWAAEHGLDGAPVFLYSGTLARKHRPALLVDLARAVRPSGAMVVVVSEGEGADWLIRQLESADDLDNLRVLPYQPFGVLPEVLGSADVLVVLLEPNAGRFSVPSKTLSYLCAGRAILASMPLDNAAARMIELRARAGLVVAPEQPEAFVTAARVLLADEQLRAELGQSGRRFAVETFAAEAVVDRFVEVLDGGPPADHEE